MKTKEGYDLYSEQEIEILVQGGKILHDILEFVSKEVKVGVKSMDIDKLAEKMVREAGADPVFKNYKPKGAKVAFPATICISTNDEVAHGLPSEYAFKDGDIVSLDLGLRYKGLVVDSAITVSVGIPTKLNMSLIETTRQALEIGMKEIRASAHVGDIGLSIDRYVRSKGYRVVDTLWGHAVGHQIHASPNIPHHDTGKKLEKLSAGMVIAVEPHVTNGKGVDIILSKDNWTLKTKDRGVTAQFEHTILVTKDGFKILT
jgi:methionyl aminopeptidase